MIVVFIIIAAVLLGTLAALCLCRAAKIGDQQMEARSARWLADKQHERAGDAWERQVLGDLVLGEWDWPE